MRYDISQLILFRDAIKRVKELQGEELTLAYLEKAIRRVIEEPEYFVRDEDELPPPGNECGLHTQFTETLSQLVKRCIPLCPNIKQEDLSVTSDYVTGIPGDSPS